MRAFVIAMEDEAAAVRVAAKPEDIFIVAGIGKVNAAAATQQAIDRGATEIVNAGLAGGFPPLAESPRSKVQGPREEEVQSLKSKVQSAEDDETLDIRPSTLDSVAVGGVYEVKSAVEYDFDLAKLNGTSVGVLNERDTPFIPMATVGKFPAKILATGDHFNDKEDDYRLITAELGAELRDMEGAAIAHVCEKAGVACRALKCVTNVAGRGSMVGQFEENRKRCLAILSEAVREWLGEK